MTVWVMVPVVYGWITLGALVPLGQGVKAGPPLGQGVMAGTPLGQGVMAGPPLGQGVMAGTPLGQGVMAGTPLGQGVRNGWTMYHPWGRVADSAEPHSLRPASTITCWLRDR